jgi:hypothetical protein
VLETATGGVTLQLPLKISNFPKTIRANAQMSREQSHYQRRCSVLPPIIDLTHNTERKQLRPLNKRQCRFENGFNVVQSRRTCSLAGGTSNGTTPSSHRTFFSSGRRPVPENRPIFPVRLGLIRPAGPTGPRLTLACQSGCLQSTVKAIPLIIRLACLSYGRFFGIGSCLPARVGSPNAPASSRFINV